MILNEEVCFYIERSTLCWLATSSMDHMPNVSPKEVFCKYRTDRIIIANIASPQTMRNIRQNKNVCVSFIDIFVQKGFQLKGKARILDKSNLEFKEMRRILEKITNGNFPFDTIFEITVIILPICWTKSISC
jgi:predicted pyridoxine 5'-phosphate oxidase superfamily flavin-nucleotide-binding protein